MSVTNAKGSSDVPQWATDRARQIVQPGENILGIYVVSDENRKNAVKQPMACFLAMPCFWPHALLMSPCLYAACQSGNKILKSTVYIITDKRLYKSVDTGELGFVCCTPGRDSGDVPHQDISGLSLDMPGAACGTQCFPVQQVIVSLPLGHPLATAGGQDSSEHRSGIPNMHMQMLVDNPQEVIQLLHSAKDALMSAPQQVVVTTAMPIAPMEMGRDDPTEQLAKLKKLLDAGAITEEEYEEKRKPYVDRL